MSLIKGRNPAHPEIPAHVYDSQQAGRVKRSSVVEENSVIKHPDMGVEVEEESDVDSISDLYERMPKRDRERKISDEFGRYSLSKRYRDRSRSLPSVHGNFLLVNRGWAPQPGDVIPEDEERWVGHERCS